MRAMLAVIVGLVATSAVSLLLLGCAMLVCPEMVPVPTAIQRYLLSDREQRLVASVNAYRAQRGLAALQVNPRLMAAARGRTNATVRTSHHVNGQWPWEAASAAGYRYTACSENLAWGYPTPESAVGQPNGPRGGWQTSPGHARAMRGSYQEIGVGVRGTTYVAMFGSPARSNGGRS